MVSIRCRKDIQEARLSSLHTWNTFEEKHTLGKATPIFPRIEIVEEEPKLDPMQVNPDLVVENPIDIDTFKKQKFK